MMKKESGKKSRRRTIECTLGEPKLIRGLGITPWGEVVALGPNGEIYKPEHSTLETFYERTNPKKPKKHINQTPPNKNRAYVTADATLIDYDAVIAIDTNTKRIAENDVSITVAVLAFKGKAPIRYPHLQIHGPIGGYEFWNVKSKPENNGWRQVIQTAERSECLSESKKIGLIVDSDLGALPSYNAGTHPIIEDFYLPKRYTLLYASADTGREFVINQLLQLADKTASRLLIQSQTETENLNPTPDMPNHSHFRAWIFD